MTKISKASDVSPIPKEQLDQWSKSFDEFERQLRKVDPGHATRIFGYEHTVRSVDNKIVISIWDKGRDRVMSLPTISNIEAFNMAKTLLIQSGHEDALRFEYCPVDPVSASGEHCLCTSRSDNSCCYCELGEDDCATRVKEDFPSEIDPTCNLTEGI